MPKNRQLPPKSPKKKGFRNSVQIDPSTSALKGKHQVSKSMVSPEEFLKPPKILPRQHTSAAEYESVLASPRIVSAKLQGVRQTSNQKLSQQMERQERQKQINQGQRDAHLSTPGQKRYGGIKLPQISSPFGHNRNELQSSSLSQHNEGLDTSILSYKRRAPPKRAKDNFSQAMSPKHEKTLRDSGQNDYTSLISGLSSQMDIDVGPPTKRRKAPTGRNALPKLNHSVVIKESKNKPRLMGANSPPRMTQATPK